MIPMWLSQITGNENTDLPFTSLSLLLRDGPDDDLSLALSISLSLSPSPFSLSLSLSD